MYSIKKAKKALKSGIQGYLLKDDGGNYLFDKVQRLPFYLEGSPGIGKTQIVSQIAEELGIGFVSFSITHHTRNSLLGLPVIKDVENGKYTEYTMSEIIAKVYEQRAHGYDEGVLLLDEFACISETLMPTMLAFLQTKNIGMYSLPEGWMIVVCGNPPEYNRSARRFDAAILDRMRKLEIKFSFDDFMEYARERDFHKTIIAYLEKNRSAVYHCVQEKGNLELVTCRSWENLSCALKANERLGAKVDREFVGQFLKYDETAGEFIRFYEVTKSGVGEEDIQNILAGVDLERYRKDWEKKTSRHWTSVLEILKKTMENAWEPGNEWDLSQQISNVFKLFDGVKWEKTLKEKFYLGINQSERLLPVMVSLRNEEYLDVCKKMYGF